MYYIVSDHFGVGANKSGWLRKCQDNSDNVGVRSTDHRHDNMEDGMFPNGGMLFLIISECLQMCWDDSEHVRMIVTMSGSEVLRKC